MNSGAASQLQLLLAWPSCARHADQFCTVQPLRRAAPCLVPGGWGPAPPQVEEGMDGGSLPSSVFHWAAPWPRPARFLLDPCGP